MFYVLCPFCRIGIEIPANDDGPDCNESKNVCHCQACDEAFFFDVRDVMVDVIFHGFCGHRGKSETAMRYGHFVGCSRTCGKPLPGRVNQLAKDDARI